MKERKGTYEDIKQMKKDKVLELPWDCLEEDEFIYLYEQDDSVCAVIRLSLDPYDSDVIWIDEFEIVRIYWKLGIGKSIIGTMSRKSTS